MLVCNARLSWNCGIVGAVGAVLRKITETWERFFYLIFPSLSCQLVALRRFPTCCAACLQCGRAVPQKPRRTILQRKEEAKNKKKKRTESLVCGLRPQTADGAIDFSRRDCDVHNVFLSPFLRLVEMGPTPVDRCRLMLFFALSISILPSFLLQSFFFSFSPFLKSTVNDLAGGWLICCCYKSITWTARAITAVIALALLQANRVWDIHQRG